MAIFISVLKPPAKPSLSHGPRSAVPLAVSVFYYFLSRTLLLTRYLLNSVTTS